MHYAKVCILDAHKVSNVTIVSYVTLNFSEHINLSIQLFSTKNRPFLF